MSRAAHPVRPFGPARLGETAFVVRFGYLLVYLGFAYGLVSLVWMARGRGDRRGRADRGNGPVGRGARVLLGVGSLVVAVSLFCPWLTGPAAGGGRLEGSGWALLDPFSTVLLAVLAAATVVAVTVGGARGGGGAIAGCAVSAGALVVGNALAQGGSAVVGLRWGAWLGVVGAVLLWAGATLAIRPPADIASAASARGSRSSPTA